ncbi:ABC-type amino acid transport substrate-binding protein [Duganella sp. 1224]|uniref:substrate-binding periplasmic protein n=1 Tax=Duganella sp. 1224 TaxID=2587052 RepID=UPI0017FACE42|nr:transporter substrate-binding domain-containing protein [Duganella sp. 1224]NYE63693.1 ABC-type amino acid transport substrate-binding protein [Duganella sp. 1224]
MKLFPPPVNRAASYLLLMVLGLSAGMCNAAMHVVYPLTSIDDDTDSRYDYDWAVLRVALQKTEPGYGPFEMKQSTQAMSAQRVTQEMLTPGGRVNVFARATSPGLERQFLPVRLPIDRGLLGYRMLLVRQNDLPRFAAVRSLADLAPLRIGQGKGWIDVPILRGAGLTVEEGSNYPGLFAMLAAGRFDGFSRGIDEAQREYKERHAMYPSLTIEPTLLLQYPLPLYFFTRRDEEGKLLAQRISDGMELMIKDGSLNALFQQYKGDSIRAGGLSRRRVLHIQNPHLTPETPLSRGELWFNPQTGK